MFSGVDTVELSRTENKTNTIKQTVLLYSTFFIYVNILNAAEREREREREREKNLGCFLSHR